MNSLTNYTFGGNGKDIIQTSSATDLVDTDGGNDVIVASEGLFGFRRGWHPDWYDGGDDYDRLIVPAPQDEVEVYVFKDPHGLTDHLLVYHEPSEAYAYAINIEQIVTETGVIDSSEFLDSSLF